MALAPSLTITLPGYPFENFPSVATISDLRALPSAEFSTGDNYVVDGATGEGDGGGGVFSWNDASTATDDGETIIRPNDTSPGQAGRWILTGSSALADRPTFADLISTASDKGGALVAVDQDADYAPDTVGWAVNIQTSDYTDLPYGFFKYRGTTTDDQAFEDMVFAQATKADMGITFPPGDITLSADHNFLGRGLTLKAAVKKRTRIITASNKRLMISPGTLDEHLAPSVFIEGLIFATSGGIHTSGPLYVVFGSNAIGSTAEPFTMRSCEVSGLTDTDGFTSAVELRNVPNPVIEGLRLYGDRRNFAGGISSVVGLKFTADGGNSGGNARITGLTAYWMDVMCQITGHHEGMRFIEPTAVGVRTGITQVGESGGNPLLQVRGGFLNCSSIGVYAKNMIHVDLSGTTYYCEAVPGDPTPAAYTAVVLENVDPLAMGGQVKGNIIDMVAGPATTKTACSIIGVAGGITDVLCDNLIKALGGTSTGYDLNSQTRRVNISATNVFNNVATPVNNLGTNNVIGSYQSF